MSDREGKEINPWLWMVQFLQELSEKKTWFALVVGITIAVVVGANVNWPWWLSVLVTAAVYLVGCLTSKTKILRNIFTGGFWLCVVITVLQLVGVIT